MSPTETLARLRLRLESYSPGVRVWVDPLYIIEGEMKLTSAELVAAQTALAAMGAQQLTPRREGARVTIGTVGEVGDLIDEALIQMDPVPATPAPVRQPSPIAALLRIFWIS